MKKIMAVLLAALMMMSLAGCTQNQAGNESSSSEQESSSVAEVQPPVVADAVLYRGTVTETSGQQLTVEQYDGRDYGEVVIVFTLPEEVENTFQEGEYVEIYYGALKESAPAQADAISVNKLADQAESVVTNGTIKEVTTSEDGTVTDLLLTDSNGQEVVFHISESTQIYMNAEDLKEGTEISVLHSGAFTMSAPGQRTGDQPLAVPAGSGRQPGYRVSIHR